MPSCHFLGFLKKSWFDGWPDSKLNVKMVVKSDEVGQKFCCWCVETPFLCVVVLSLNRDHSPYRTDRIHEPFSSLSPPPIFNRRNKLSHIEFNFWILSTHSMYKCKILMTWPTYWFEIWTMFVIYICKISHCSFCILFHSFRGAAVLVGNWRRRNLSICASRLTRVKR